MSVTIVGLDQFIEGLNLAREAVKPVVEKASLAMALQVRRLAQDKAPKRSTTLAQSITAEPIEYGAQTTVEEIYGIYVEEGTGMFDPRGAHLIYSSTGGPLHWQEGGEDHFAMWTRGMEAQPFFQPAIDEAMPFVEEEMGRAVDSLIHMAVGA